MISLLWEVFTPNPFMSLIQSHILIPSEVWLGLFFSITCLLSSFSSWSCRLLSSPMSCSFCNSTTFTTYIRKTSIKNPIKCLSSVQQVAHRNQKLKVTCPVDFIDSNTTTVRTNRNTYIIYC